MLGFQAPDGLVEHAMSEIHDMSARASSRRSPSIRRSISTEQKLKFASEVGNVELLEEAIQEAEALGHTGSAMEDARRSLARCSTAALPGLGPSTGPAPPQKGASSKAEGHGSRPAGGTTQEGD